jgi:DNA-binding CsgD family transcriptional regulator
VGIVAQRHRLRRELIAACYEGLDSIALRRKALRLLADAIPLDAAFFATADPVTMLHTTAVTANMSADLSPRFLHNEFAVADVNKWRVLAAADVPVNGLDRATHGNRLHSPRYAEILRPIGLGDELRAALRTHNSCWGFLCLHREDTTTGFSPTETEFLAGLVPHLAEGLRRSVLAQSATMELTDDGPGVALIDEEGAVAAATPTAARLLAELAEADEPRPARLPIAATAVLQCLRAINDTDAEIGIVPRLTARTAAGRWVVLHASRLTTQPGVKPQTTLVIEPAGHRHLAATIVAAYGLTPRESQITERLLRGLPAKRIATECRISQHTVRDHCKSIFAKVGVNSRGELMATLFRMTSTSRTSVTN